MADVTTRGAEASACQTRAHPEVIVPSPTNAQTWPMVAGLDAALAGLPKK
jgi:hypothetical protein